MKTETFGQRLKRLRETAGLTQVQLAERASVPLTTLRNWEYDRREPLVGAAFRLARALGVSCEAFQVEDKPAEKAPAAKKTTKKRKGKE